MELATEENALFAFDPIKRIVPTTRTRITASMTAYSAMSCPESSDQSFRTNFVIALLQAAVRSLREERTEFDFTHDARGPSTLSNKDFQHGLAGTILFN